MNSYPPELLAQLAPVMFVAGLDPPTNPPPTPGPVPPTPEGPNLTPSTPANKFQDPFTVLMVRLRDALTTQRKVAIWQPEKNKTFHVIPVDREVGFPPRKFGSGDGGDSNMSPATTAHSPLSPLTPASPLYPDGLIAPIWIRKHTTFVPSVFVLFLRIYEFPPHNPRSPLDPPDAERERDRELEERRRDTELAAEVALRKRSTNDRGIKLTVVLMASRRMLDDPSLDGRLTFIRRQSGLDSRAALFVLSPVSPAELGDFVKSLQQALYEPAVEYYTAHSKRVRRKRNRHSQAAYHVPPSPLTSANLARPLRPEGWTVRYEYKMACFAEFRGEDEVALKHYQDAYEMLVFMFCSTAILPPRTKRWAEAKVLADCINLKVTKLYLYNNEHALALSHHNTHLRKFSDYSRGWGIGEETFEYWSWIARQHRVLAELLEQGTRGTLVIPTHKPAPANATNPALLASQIQVPSQRAANPLEDAMRSLGVNPSHALQHPGFYYYMAARCTEMRRIRFMGAVEAEERQQLMISSPGFANEKKVDHLVIILELYTKAYELFKKYAPVNPNNPTQGRLTLWIAYRIAQTYYESGKFDMAVRFFERIAKTYRREKWDEMLRPLLATWYTCAQRLADVELSIQLLMELLGHDGAELDDPSSLEEDLMAVLKSTVPSSADTPLVVDLSESRPLFKISANFWAQEVKVDEPNAFQVVLEAPPLVTITSLPFDSVAIYFSDDPVPLVVQHSEGLNDNAHSIQRVDLGHIVPGQEEERNAMEAHLRWKAGGTVVFSGTMSSPSPGVLKISRVVLTIIEGNWKIEIPCAPSDSRQIPTSKWLCSLDPPRFTAPGRGVCPSSTVRHRPHRVDVSVSHRAPAFINEEYPIIIDITNMDDHDLDVSVDVLLQPTEIDGAVNTIFLDDERSSGLISVRCGKLGPGVSVLKTLHLLNTGGAGDRVIDISTRSRPGENGEGNEAELQNSTETLRTLVIPTIEPFKVTQEVVYHHATGDWAGLADLRTYESEFWDDRKGGSALVNTRVEFVGPWGLELVSVELRREDNQHARVWDCSLDQSQDTLPDEFLAGDTFSEFCRVSLAPPEDDGSQRHVIPGPGQYNLSWRRILDNGEKGSLSISIISLPSLEPPPQGLVALLDVPAAGKLHQPLPLVLKIRNHHPSRSANITVQLEGDVNDSFIVAGLRSGRLPILMPGAEEKVMWQLIPMECGYCKIPGIHVLDMRRSLQIGPGASSEVGLENRGEEVKIVDVKMDIRREDGGDAEGGNGDTRGGHIGTVLILP